MATCQQDGRGNIIQRRKAAAISPHTPVWERARLHSKLRLFIRISNFFFCLPVSALLCVCLLPALWSVPGLFSRQSSRLPYDVCAGFSAVSTQRYDSVTMSLVNVCLSCLFELKLNVLDIQLTRFDMQCWHRQILYFTGGKKTPHKHLRCYKFMILIIDCVYFYFMFIGRTVTIRLY